MPFTADQIKELVEDAERSSRITAWERDFMASMAEGIKHAGSYFRPSARQEETLRKIEAKLYSV